MTRTVSRRDFLHMVGAAGGSTAVYRAALGLGLFPAITHAARPKLAAAGRKPPKVLILGAGISGLTSAYELNKKGSNLTNIEKIESGLSYVLMAETLCIFWLLFC